MYVLSFCHFILYYLSIPSEELKHAQDLLLAGTVFCGVDGVICSALLAMGNFFFFRISEERHGYGYNRVRQVYKYARGQLIHGSSMDEDRSHKFVA